MALDLTSFDPAHYLNDTESVVAYLEDALADEDPGEFFEALKVVARAKVINEAGRNARVAPPETYGSPEASGQLDFATVLALMKGLGLGLRIVPQATVPVREPAATAK